MITKKEIKDIFVGVEQNNKKLNSCIKPHNFSIDTTPEKPFNKIFKCSKCNGTTNHIYKTWYEKGLKHAGVVIQRPTKNIKDN